MKESEKIWHSVQDNELNCINRIFHEIRRIQELRNEKEWIPIRFHEEILFNSVDDHSDEFLVGITTDGKTVKTVYCGDYNDIELQDITIAFKIKILEQLENIISLEQINEVER